MLVKTFRYFGVNQRNKFIKIIFVQSALGLLDLLGVTVIGLIGALSVAGIKSGLPGGRVSQILTFLGLEKFSFQMQVALLSILGITILILKTIFSIIYTRRILFYLSLQGAEMSTRIISKILTKSYMFIRTRNLQETIYNTTTGVTALTLGVVGNLLTLVADISLTILISGALFLIDPLVAGSTFVIFAGIFLALSKLTHAKSAHLGEELTKKSVESINEIESTLRLFREISISGLSKEFVSRNEAMRIGLSKTASDLSFLPNLSKYIIESSVILGAVTIAAVQFLLQDSNRAIATLTIFLAAGSRIAPALLRTQQSIFQIKSNLGSAQGTMKLIDELNSEVSILLATGNETQTDFNADLKISNLKFSYGNSTQFALQIPSLKIESGSFVAIVGPSGSGKTTLVDLLLGVITPDDGELTISGLSPRTSSMAWKTEIRYVPQDIWIFNGTLRENITLESNSKSDVANNRLASVIDRVQLNDFIKQLPKGFETIMSSGGSNLSGGQKQRIGIARALYSDPHFIVLDEATSSLDATSENEITKYILDLKGQSTVIMIAHRLASVVNADIVIYLEDGKILAQGSFEHVRNTVPNFDSQANLMGL